MTTFEIEPGRLFIGGQWQEAADGARIDVIDPARGAVVTTSRRRRRRRRCRRARRPRRVRLGRMVGAVRPRTGAILQRVADADARDAEELARRRAWTSASRSPSPGWSTSTTPPRCTSTTPASRTPSTAPCARRRATRTSTRREPIGVVAAITPFNFPLILSSTKIAPALVAGNTVVHKPASDTPLSALLMAQILQEAGVPDGVFNVVTGSGAGRRRSPRRAPGRRQGRLHRLDRDRRARGELAGRGPQAVHRRTRRQRAPTSSSRTPT